jgi:glycosyltransferase involved in cell wall biosynthesis
MDQPKTPLVSIIIPVFNRAKLIHNTLNSLLAQNYQNWECIVVDDGSTDNTIEVVSEFQNKDIRIQIHIRNETPKGAPTCRNIGLKKSIGKYIIFLDSDDLLLSYALESRICFLEQNSHLDFCVSSGIRGDYPLNLESKYYYISTYKNQDVIKEFFNLTIPWITLNPTYKRASLISNEIFWDTHLKGFQDIDFHVHTITKGLKFEYLKGEPDCWWTAHNNGNIGKELGKNGIHHTQKLYILNKYKARLTDIQALQPLALRILNESIDNSLPIATFKSTFEILQKSNTKFNTIGIYLLKGYKMSFRYKIPVLPRIIKTLIVWTGNTELIELKPNHHFIKKEYPAKRLTKYILPS